MRAKILFPEGSRELHGRELGCLHGSVRGEDCAKCLREDPVPCLQWDETTDVTRHPWWDDVTEPGGQ